MACARGIIVTEGRFLLVKRHAKDKRGGQWCLPGGHIRHGEGAAEACEREVLEETGLRVRAVDCVATNKGTQFFSCELISPPGELNIDRRENDTGCWTTGPDCLTVGMVMDLRLLLRALNKLGIPSPSAEELSRIQWPSPTIHVNDSGELQ